MCKEQFVLHLTLFVQNCNGEEGNDKLLEEDELVGTVAYNEYDTAKMIYDMCAGDGPGDEASLIVVTMSQRRLLRDVLAEAGRLNEDARQAVEMRAFQGLHLEPADIRIQLLKEWEGLRTLLNIVEQEGI